MLMKKLFLLIFGFLLFDTALGQVNGDSSDPYNNWDGITHWSKYMRYSPRYFGPNALPIPEIINGKIGKHTEIMLAADYHHHKNDPTQNIFTRIEIPIVKNKANLEIHVVPIEFYNMDSSLRIERRTFNKEGKGTAGGDIYVNQHIQLLSQHRSLPDANLRIGLRSASGTMLRHARYTDAPGYFFDLGLGKNIYQHPTDSSFVRIYASAGFYCWHTNEDDLRQNDALMFGGGIDWKTKSWLLSLQTAGYVGYINNGDKPLVARAKIHKKITPHITTFLHLQHGIHDFYYTSIRFGCSWRL
jgi:hypothetical protein